MKRIFKIILALVVVGALAAGGYWLYQTRFAPTAATPQSFTQIVPVREGTLSDNVSVVGELDAEQMQDLTFDYIDGAEILKSLAVAAGNVVKQGQVLASVDPAPYQQALDQAKSDLQAAEKALEELKTPATTLELAQADLSVAQAEYQMQEAYDALAELSNPDLPALALAVEDARNALAKAQSDLAVKQNDKSADKDLYELQVTEGPLTEDYNRLAAETYSDEFYQDRLRIAFNKMMDAQDTRVTFEIQRAADLFDAQAQVRTAQRTLTQAEKALSDAQGGGNKLDLANANLNVRTAEVALEQAHADRTALDAGADPNDIAAAQADVDRKRLAVEKAETALAGTELKAPFDGTVLETNVRAGDQITDSTVIMTLADLTQLQVFAFVDETTIRRIKEGQNAQISFDAFPGQTFNGKVLAVPLQGTLQNDVMVYQVPLSLQGTENLPLLVGMTANVEVQTAQADNALLVPSMALTRDRGQYMLMLVNPSDPQGTPVPTPVEVGLSDGTFTQIVQGVQAGDQVVMTIQAGNSNSPFGNFRTFSGGPGGGVIITAPVGGFQGGGGGGFRQPGGGNQRTNP